MSDAPAFTPELRGLIELCLERRARIPDVDVEKIRSALGLTQRAFSELFGVPIDTLRNWEYGRRTPEIPARILFLVFERFPEHVLGALYPELLTP